MLWSKLLLEPSFPSLPGRPLSGLAGVAFFLLNASSVAGKGWQRDFQERGRSLMSVKGSKVFQVLVPTAQSGSRWLSASSLKCPNQGAYYSSKINLESKEKIFNKERPQTLGQLSHTKKKRVGQIVACYLDQGHVDKAEAYLPASYLTQMPSYLVTEFKGIFKKHGEREKKENQ